LSSRPREPFTPSPQAAPDVLTRRLLSVFDQHEAAVALSVAGRDLTYRQLQERAGLVASRLRSLGVGSGCVVAVPGRRNQATVVAIAGVILAGSAYMPVDPKLPPARLAAIGRLAAPSALVWPAAEPVPPFSAPVVALDAAGFPAPSPAVAPMRRAVIEAPPDLAYVLFTSGTTGEQKAVAVRRSAVVNLVCGQDYVRFGQDQVLLHTAPPSFDASTFEIWGALLHGARLVIAPPERPTADSLYRTIAEFGVTTAWLTSGLFERIVAGRADALAGLRQLLTGGDVVAVAAAERFLEAFPETLLVNGYGPTEATTFACTHRVTAADLCAPSLPIGRAIRGVTVVVADHRLREVGAGERGEICIGGAGLASGYLGRPDLTSRMFVRLPSGSLPRRVYRSGDFGSYRPDGVLEFCGRRDNQVKIRGHRVELGEVESVLRSHQAVGEAAAVAVGEGAARRRLAAFVVPLPGQTIESGELRRFAAAHLPEASRPAFLDVVEGLPLTPPGKLDRQRLARRIRQQPSRSAAPDIADGGAASWAETLWCQELGVADCDLDDDFFECGGDSLIAVSLLGVLEQRTGVALPMSVLYEGRTLRALRDAVAGYHKGLWTPLVPIRARGRTPLFCVHGLNGDVFGFYALARHLPPDIAVFALRGLGERTPARITTDLLVQYYLNLVRHVAAHGPYRLVGYSAGGIVAFAMAAALAQDGEDAGVILLDADPPRHWLSSGRLGMAANVPHDAPLPEMEQKELTQAVREVPLAGTYAARRIEFMTAFYEAVLTSTPITADIPVRVCRTARLPTDLYGAPGDPAGWRHFTASSVQTFSIPGSHQTLFTEPYVHDVARVVSGCARDLDAQFARTNPVRG